MRRPLVILGALAGLLTGPAAAHAGDSLVRESGTALLAGPELAGGAAVWVEARKDGHAVVRGGGTAGRPVAIHRYVGVSGEQPEIAGAPDGVAVHRRGRSAEEVLLGSASGPLRTVAACRAGSARGGDAPCAAPPCPGSPLPALSLTREGTVAWRFRCSGPLRVRDAAGAQRTVVVGAAPRVAGGFVASSERTPAGGEAVVVRSLADGAERLRVAGAIREFDVGEDGALVFVTLTNFDPRNAESDIWLATPDAPEPRLLAHVPGDAVARLAGDRIAWSAQDTSGFPRVDVVRRDGTPVAGGRAESLVERQGFAFDGERLAWALRPCGRFRFAVWSLAGLPPGQPAGCGRLTLRSARWTRGRRAVRFVLRCAGAPAGGCSTGLQVTLRRGGRRLAALERGAPISVEPGRRAVVVLKAPRRARRATYARVVFSSRVVRPRLSG